MHQMKGQQDEDTQQIQSSGTRTLRDGGQEENNDVTGRRLMEKIKDITPEGRDVVTLSSRKIY